jgi:hypothetical protein
VRAGSSRLLRCEHTGERAVRLQDTQACFTLPGSRCDDASAKAVHECHRLATGEWNVCHATHWSGLCPSQFGHLAAVHPSTAITTWQLCLCCS